MPQQCSTTDVKAIFDSVLGADKNVSVVCHDMPKTLASLPPGSQAALYVLYHIISQSDWLN